MPTLERPQEAAPGSPAPAAVEDSAAAEVLMGSPTAVGVVACESGALSGAAAAALTPARKASFLGRLVGRR